MNDKEHSCADWQKATQLGLKQADEMFVKLCRKEN